MLSVWDKYFKSTQCFILLIEQFCSEGIQAGMYNILELIIALVQHHVTFDVVYS